MRYLILFILLNTSALGQEVKPDIFFVPRLPTAVAAKNPNLLGIINKKIASLKDYRDVYKVLKSNLGQYPQVDLTVLRVRSAGHLERYFFVPDMPSFGSTDLSQSKAARAIDVPKIYERYQLEEYLSDTIAVWDTLNIKVVASQFKIPNKGLFNVASDSSSLSYEWLANKDLIIFPANPGQTGRYLHIRYRLPGSVALSFYCYFLSDDNKRELQYLASSLNAIPALTMPLNRQGLSDAISQYVGERFGKAKGWDILKALGL
jgi:hypothetical protein